MIARVCVLGRPPSSPRYPQTARAYALAVPETMLAWRLWHRHFVGQIEAVGRPHVYWSAKIGRRTLVHAKCFHWGIVVSTAQYRRVRTSQRTPWLVRVLKHELCHWAGYRHDARFRDAAKRLGTW